MADTKPTDPASSHQNASADEADARFLRWAEERLVGTHELCCLCRGDGWDPYTERTCAECQGAGQCIRHEYIMAENALSPEQSSAWQTQKLESSETFYD